ncbi:methylmalonyl-CoA/ethylmalonyl-CoA epimerase [Neobacillus niacini]|uniref:VOC family protein n=1 Tax=Neobacillus niacini TaxID=86668 RepID=UPI002784D805|nr:VOC family protein [Neobacillus niacini]MDQ1002217.1 methylmalonyl-CoA/ethylmalonyl-CoA epimerase [Neobacillus niacini]
MNGLKVDHITIAVKDLPKAKQLFTMLFNGEFIKEIELEEQNARAAYYLWNDIVIGLETPLSDSGDIYRFLERKGEGVHHIALNTNKLSSISDELTELGVKIIGEQEKDRVKREAFTHPKTSLGVLLQLMEWEEPYKSSLEKRLEILGEE